MAVYTPVIRDLRVAQGKTEFPGCSSCFNTCVVTKSVFIETPIGELWFCSQCAPVIQQLKNDVDKLQLSPGLSTI